jgi:enediyne biosynthesis protein E4
LNDMLSTEAIDLASKLYAYNFETTYFRNDQGRFTIQKLPIQIQFSPVFAMAIADVNHDGHDDLITGGNLERTRARTGLLKGNNGYVFLGDGKGNFHFLSPANTGINIVDDVRKIVTDSGRVFFVTNNGHVRSFHPTKED